MFGERLAAARRAKGLTQDQLATTCCVARQTISSWENGRSYPDLASLVRIGDTLGVSLDTLLKGDAAMRAVLAKRERLVADSRWVYWACYGVNAALILLLTLPWPSPFAMGWGAKGVGFALLFLNAAAVERSRTVLTKLSGRRWLAVRPGRPVSYDRPRWHR